jgi:hypothetical protein
MSTDPAIVEGPVGRLADVGRFGYGALSLIAANAGLLVFYFVYGLSLYQLVVVFWCECLWVGLFSALKLITASFLGNPYENRWASVSKASSALMSIFVIGIASGSFFALLGMTLFMIIGAGEMLPQSANAGETLELVGVGLGVSFLFIVSHAVSFVINFLVLGEFRVARVSDLVALPFKRCLSLLVAMSASFAVIFLVPELASTAVFSAAVIVLKLLGDLRLHLRERQTFAASPTDPK